MAQIPVPPVGPPPSAATLREAALTHLARYATTRAGLLRVLDRRILRWARTAEGDTADAVAIARQAARAETDRLVAQGLIDDAAFAANRARSLGRAGRSRRAVAAHLAARGVAGETTRAVLPDDPEAEFAAAVAFTRRRRIGPFRAAPFDVAIQQRELGMLARAGFSRDIANRALRLERDLAETLLRQVREGWG